MSTSLASLEPEAWLEAAVCIKHTGVPIATWTRRPTPESVLEVMAATMIASIETLVEALGGTSPETIMLEVDERRIFVAKLGTQASFILVAPRAVSENALRHESFRLLEKLTVHGRHASEGRDAISTRR